jgi:hypothetical protein
MRASVQQELRVTARMSSGHAHARVGSTPVGRGGQFAVESRPCARRFNASPRAGGLRIRRHAHARVGSTFERERLLVRPRVTPMRASVQRVTWNPKGGDKMSRPCARRFNDDPDRIAGAARVTPMRASVQPIPTASGPSGRGNEFRSRGQLSIKETCSSRSVFSIRSAISKTCRRMVKALSGSSIGKTSSSNFAVSP